MELLLRCCRVNTPQGLLLRWGVNPPPGLKLLLRWGLTPHALVDLGWPLCCCAEVGKNILLLRWGLTPKCLLLRWGVDPRACCCVGGSTPPRPKMVAAAAGRR